MSWNVISNYDCMSIKTKLIKISNFINNFYKLAGVEEEEFKRSLDSLLYVVNEFENDCFEDDSNMGESNISKLYSSVQYTTALSVVYMKSGFGFETLKAALEQLDNLCKSLSDVYYSNCLDSASSVYSKIYVDILSSNFYMKKRFKSQDNYKNAKIESLKNIKNWNSRLELTNDKDIINEITSLKVSNENINQEAKVRAIDDVKKQQTEDESEGEIFTQDEQSEEQQQQEIIRSLENQEFISPEEEAGGFTGGLAQSADKYRNEIQRDMVNEDAIDQEFTKSLSEVAQKSSEDENTGVRTFNVGRYDNGIGQLERNKANILASKQKIDQLISASEEQIQDYSSGKKKNETLVLTINEKLLKYKESAKLYSIYLSLIDKELNVRQLINEKENKFVTELRTVFDNSSLTELEEDRKIYFEVQTKIKAIKQRKRETAISREELNELKILQEKAKISKSKYDDLIKNKKNQISSMVQNRLAELNSKYESNDPTKYDEEESIKKTGAELIKLKKEIFNLSSQKDKLVIDRGNLYKNIVKSENELWLDLEGKNIKDPTKAPFKKENYIKAIKKIKALTQIDKKRKSLNIVSDINKFLARDSSNEKDIVDFYNKILENFNTRPVSSAYVWQKDLEDDIYKKIDKLQQDITSVITNTFSENMPSKDEAFLNFVGMDIASQQKFKEEMDKYLLEVVEYQASSLSRIKEEVGEGSEEYKKMLASLYNLIETNTKFSNALKFLIEKSDDGLNQFDRLKPHRLKYDSTRKMIELSNSIGFYKRYIDDNLSKFKDLRTRNIEIQKIKNDLEFKFAEYQKLLNALKAENIELYNGVVAFNKEMEEVYIRAIKAIENVPEKEALKNFKGKATTDFMQKASRFFMTEARKLILDHIVRYKQSKDISKINNVYYHWKNLNDKVVAIKAIISNIEKTKEKLNKTNKNILGLSDEDKKKLLLNTTSKDATSQVLFVFGELDESKQITVSVKMYLEKIKSIANDILEDNDFIMAAEAMESAQAINCSNKILNGMIEVINYVEEYGE